MCIRDSIHREIGINSRPVIIVETMSDTMYLNAFDKFLQDPNISMNPLNVVPTHNKNSVLPYRSFIEIMIITHSFYLTMTMNPNKLLMN